MNFFKRIVMSMMVGPEGGFGFIRFSFREALQNAISNMKIFNPNPKVFIKRLAKEIDRRHRWLHIINHIIQALQEYNDHNLQTMNVLSALLKKSIENGGDLSEAEEEVVEEAAQAVRAAMEGLN